MQRALVIGRHAGSIPDVEIVETRPVQFPATAVVAVVNTLDGKIRLTYGEPTPENIARARERAENGYVVILSDEEYQNHA